MIEFLVEYELRSSWVAYWVSTPWLRTLVGKHYVNKVKRKLTRMKEPTAIRDALIAEYGSLQNALDGGQKNGRTS
jgi:hypothetical protein